MKQRGQAHALEAKCIIVRATMDDIFKVNYSTKSNCRYSLVSSFKRTKDDETISKMMKDMEIENQRLKQDKGDRGGAYSLHFTNLLSLYVNLFFL